LDEADRLENILETRYEGKLWHEETITGEIDPRLKRTEENLAALNELKENIIDCVEGIRKEFKEAQKARTMEDDDVE